jgi:hypothetical protein
MGIIISIYRDDYRSERCVFKDVDRITLVNVPGPFDATPSFPAAIISRNALGNPIIIPDPEAFDLPSDSYLTFGGSYGAASDSRFGDTIRKLGGSGYCAVPIHDYQETYAD